MLRSARSTSATGKPPIVILSGSRSCGRSRRTSYFSAGVDPAAEKLEILRQAQDDRNGNTRAIDNRRHFRQTRFMFRVLATALAFVFAAASLNAASEIVVA